jgi:superfamily II DNA/RNA helicase
MSFKELNLDPILLKAVEASGFSAPTDIQRQAIPVVLAGRDLMASAQTGTGKTAAFVLPALQRLLTPSAAKGFGPRVLVLTPTRELAMQVSDNIRTLGRMGRFTSGSVVGGMPYPPQIKLLKQPLDLLVATPGRLMDHMETGRVDFSRLEMLVLDEADRMLDMGFVNAVRQIAGATPKNRQTLLFSATLEGTVLKIARELLKNPAQIQLAANHEQHASIEQRIHQVDGADHKHSLLTHYLENDALTQAVIFTATKRGADRLAKTLTDKGHEAAALHGNMNQGQRKRTVERMKRGEFRLLVATDVAARGLDIKGISHVINFDLPMVAEDYIHRIGRTGRAGATGTAVSLVGPDDRHKLHGIERLTGRKLERVVVPGLEPRKPELRSSGRDDGQRFKPRPGNGQRQRQGKPRDDRFGAPRGGDRFSQPRSGNHTAQPRDGNHAPRGEQRHAAPATARRDDRRPGGRPAGQRSGKPSGGQRTHHRSSSVPG